MSSQLAPKPPNVASTQSEPPTADSSKLIITISGKQAPDALKRVMDVLGVDPDAQLSDFGQIVVRDRFLATAILHSTRSQQLLKDILFQAHESGLQVDFSVPSLASSASSLAPLPSACEEHVATVFAPDTIPPSFLTSLTAVLSEHGARVLRIDRLTDPKRPFMSLQFRVAVADASTALAPLRRALFELGRSQPTCDLSLQRANAMRNSRRIVVFDLSWTLVQCDTVNALLAAADIAVPSAGADAYASGALSAVDWLHQRVELLANVRADRVYARAVAALRFTDGAPALCRALRRLGCRIGVVTSGSRVIAEAAKDALDMDFSFGNEIEVDSAGRFTGTVGDPVIDAERKAELVHMLAMQEKVGLEQIVAVGDGPVSAQMLECAGLSIAFDQPETAGNVQSGQISSKSLDSVLYLLGVTPYDMRSVVKP